MASVTDQITIAANYLSSLKNEHYEKIKAEEEMLLNAKLELGQLEYLQYEAQIEAARALRQSNINEVNSLQAQLKNEAQKYFESLKSKTNVTKEIRKQKITEYIEKFYKKSNMQVHGGFIPQGCLIPGWINITTLPVRSYYSNGAVRFDFINDSSVQRKIADLNEMGAVIIKSIRKTNSDGTSVDQNCYGMRVSQFVNDEIQKARQEKDSWVVQGPGFAFEYNYGDGQTWSGNKDVYNLRPTRLLGLIYSCYPFYDDYISSPQSYPNFVNFAEEVPWPTPMDLFKALKRVAKYGEKEYAQKSIERLKKVAQENTNPQATQEKVLLLPGNYFHKGLNKDISVDEHSTMPILDIDKDGNIISHESAGTWYSPRPKDNHVFIPGFDYIDPAKYIEIPERIVKAQTIYGEYVQEMKRLESKNRLQRNLNSLQTFINPLRGGPWCAASPESDACKIFRDTTAFSMGAAKVWIAAAAGYLTGGLASGIASTSMALAQDENLGLGSSDLGRILLALGEAYAIADITNSSIQRALQNTFENQVYAIAKREIGNSTGLNKTPLGQLALDLTGGTAMGMYRDQSFVDSIQGSADKSWRMAVARQSPVGALLVAGASEVEKHGFSIDSLDPMDWFNSIDVGGELQRIRHSIQGRDIAKLIGLTYMNQAGMISNEQALMVIGQEASKRNIERFYHDRPVVEDPETMAYYEKEREVNRWKQGIHVLQKLDKGLPPTKDDLMILTENVAGPIYDRVQSLGLPKSVEVNFWKIAIEDVGLPNIPQFVPDASFTLPDWMKSSKSKGEVTLFNEQSVQNYLDEKYSLRAELTKEDIVELILMLLPPGVPLVPIAKTPQEPTFNYINEFGKLTIRPPLRFPYDHPMLSTGRIKKKYSAQQKQYMMERERELQRAQAELARINAEIERLNLLSNSGNMTSLA